MTPEARAAMGSRLLHWLPVRLRHKGRVLRCAACMAAGCPPHISHMCRRGRGSGFLVLGNHSPNWGGAPKGPPGTRLLGPSPQFYGTAYMPQLAVLHRYGDSITCSSVCAHPCACSTELTSIITGDSRSGGGGGAYERKLEQDSLLSGRAFRPS